MSTGAEQKPASGQKPAGGLKSALKIALPLGFLVAIVGGLTYITQYTPTDTDKPPDGPDNPVNSNEPPLIFATSTRRFDPPRLTGKYRHFPLLAPSGNQPEMKDENERDYWERSFNFNLPDRLFQGIFEPSQEQLRHTQFWFENRNPNPVLMQLKGLSCGNCTGGRVAAIPAKVTSDLLHHAGLAALPVGAFNPFGVGLTQPLAGLALPPDKGGLVWTEYGFQADPNAIFKVPAADPAANKWAPQWGILELKFKVTGQPGPPPDPLQAVFATQVEGTSQVGGNQFMIGFEITRPFMMWPMTIDVGKIDQLTGEREFDVLVFSATRGPGSEFGDLETPAVTVTTPGGLPDPVKFVEVTRIERVPDTELADVIQRFAEEQKRLTRVRSAFRMKVVVRPKVGETRMDIGLMERTIHLSAGGATLQLPIKAMVRGSVWLDGDRTDFEMGTFAGAKEHIHRVALVTERPGMELVIVKDECQPPGFTYELTKQPDRGDRGAYQLKVTVPPGQYGSFKGTVVLEAKGPNGQRIRIPFRGTGKLG